MEFVVGIPITLGKFISIWVIVDRLTKSTYFVSVKVNNNAKNLSKIYNRGIKFCCMVYLFPSFHIEALYLLYTLGFVCSESWVRSWR